MATYHTPIAVGADADAATFNAPMLQLDDQLVLHNTEIVNARGTMGSIDARLDVSLAANGTLGGNVLTAQSQVNLGDAAAINGDAVRYNEYSVHTHGNILYPIFGVHSVSVAADTAAPDIAWFTRTDDNTNWIVFIRARFYKRSNVDGLYLTGWKANTSATLEGSIRLTCNTETATEAVTASAPATPFELALNIAALDDDDTHEIAVDMRYAAGAGGATGEIHLDDVQIWAARTAATPA